MFLPFQNLKKNELFLFLQLIKCFERIKAIFKQYFLFHFKCSNYNLLN